MLVRTMHPVSKSAFLQSAAPPPERMTIALRALTQLEPVVGEFEPPTGRQRKQRKPSEWILVFDTETTAKSNAGQSLRFGAYQVRKGIQLMERGLFYEPEALTFFEQAALESYAKAHALKLLTREQFVEGPFFDVAFHWRGTVVGFNLPFDIARIAVRHSTARRHKRNTKRGVIRDNTMSGGFSFCLSDDDRFPHVQIKHLNRRAAFIRLTSASENRGTGAAQKAKERGHEVDAVAINRGYFVDVRTIAAALLSRSTDLAHLAEHLQTEHRKTALDDYGRSVDEEMIRYAINDVQVTWECFEKLRNRYDSYRLTKTPLHRVYSEASVAKALAREIGIKSQAELDRSFPRVLQGQIMSTFYGGRAEAGLRHQIAEVAYCDARSMYPTVCVSMGLWRYFTASGINWREDTARVQDFLDNLRIDDLQHVDTWKRLVAIVRVGPEADVFPVRAPYAAAVRMPKHSPPRTIGLNFLSSHQPMWFTLADCVVSKFRTGRTPRILDAIVFEPLAPQEGLAAIDLFGDEQCRVDPLVQDLFLELINLRGDVLDRRKAAQTQEEWNGLDAQQLALKITANSLTYGVNAELNEEDLGEERNAACLTYSGNPYSIDLDAIERPGTLFNPLLATLITAGARLMLTLAELQGQMRGLPWVFCDTDSVAYQRPPGMPRKEFHKHVDAARAWFEPLNPYRKKDPLLKLEEANFALVDGKPDQQQRHPLFCYVVSSKRYALFNRDRSGLPILRKASAHGLGHVLDPYRADQAPAWIPSPSADLHDIGCRRWQHDLWYCIVLAALKGLGGPDYSKLPNFDQPAPTQDTITTPDKLRLFDTHNLDKPRLEQVAPFNFYLTYQSQPVLEVLVRLADHGGLESSRKPGKPKLSRPIAPYCRDPREAAELCVDRDTLQPFDKTALRTYSQVFARFHRHPEAKFLNGGPDDKGRTRMRHVQVESIQNIGKEANQSEDQAIFGSDPEAQAIYRDLQEYERALSEVRQALEELTHGAVAAAAGISTRQVGSIARGTSRPKPCTLDGLCKAVAEARRLESERVRQQAEHRTLLAQLVARDGYRSVADQLGVDPSNLRKMIKGHRIAAGAHS